MEKYYFKSIDETTCYTLNKFIEEAKEDNLSEITLIEAIPSDEKQFVYCGLFGEVTEKQDCRKIECNSYSSKSGRGSCRHRGKLFDFGEEVKISISTGGFLA